MKHPNAFYLHDDALMDYWDSGRPVRVKVLAFTDDGQVRISMPGGVFNVPFSTLEPM